MISRDLSIDFLGVHFGNPFCLSSSPVGNCYEMCSKAYDAGWGGIVFKTIAPKVSSLTRCRRVLPNSPRKARRLSASRTWSR